MGNFNQLVLLGRFKEIISSKKKEAIFSIDFTDADNVHHYVPIHIAGYIIDKVKEYCKTNDVIGIRGSITTDKDNNIIILGDKITFLSSAKM